jgi:limonene-1,2-epoxide hydrolase
MRNPKVVLFPVLLIFLASACASSQPITEPVAVIEAFNEALNDLDLDAAMSFVAEDAEFRITTTFSGTFSGKSEIRGVYQQSVDESWQWEIIDIQADGDKVSWTDLLTIGAGRYENSYQAVVQEGLIISLTMDV